MRRSSAVPRCSCWRAAAQRGVTGGTECARRVAVQDLSRRGMQARRAFSYLALALVGAAPLAGCKGDRTLAGGLRSAGVGGSPDEFMVLPTRPLEMPQNMSALPAPTPGVANRVDYQPKAEAIAGLTGRSGGVATTNGSA